MFIPFRSTGVCLDAFGSCSRRHKTNLALSPTLRIPSSSRRTVPRITARTTRKGLSTHCRRITGRRRGLRNCPFIPGPVAPIQNDPDVDDPTVSVRETWAAIMAGAALRLFDEYAPADGLEDRDMHRHVKARFCLALALGGRGKSGRALFERALGIALPEPEKARRKLLPPNTRDDLGASQSSHRGWRRYHCLGSSQRRGL